VVSIFCRFPLTALGRRGADTSKVDLPIPHCGPTARWANVDEREWGCYEVSYHDAMKPLMMLRTIEADDSQSPDGILLSDDTDGRPRNQAMLYIRR
jgi:hypothetical protein